ncbi:T9SS type B sorting domain-containing protein [Aquimarina sp. MAR_2010_214]|uniref:T9SS type B sorting domain-containing protein n=1 Tax=Aquimarina sp. MAR_2010_214 TaxID=1250026 RepID=UPI001178C2B4
MYWSGQSFLYTYRITYLKREIYNIFELLRVQICHTLILKFHNIYVRDKNGCLPITTQDISVVGFPEYFTPNGDGFHETWNVEGISTQIMGNSLIYIFDSIRKTHQTAQSGKSRLGRNL